MFKKFIFILFVVFTVAFVFIEKSTDTKTLDVSTIDSRLTELRRVL